MSSDYFALDQEDADLGAAMSVFYESTGTVPYVPDTGGGSFGWDKVAGAIGGIAQSGLAFMKARDSYSLGLAQSKADNELARLRLSSDVTRANLQAQTEAARLRNEYNYAVRGLQMPSMGGLFYGGSGGSGSGYSTIMLLLTAGGVYLAWKALKR